VYQLSSKRCDRRHYQFSARAYKTEADGAGNNPQWIYW